MTSYEDPPRLRSGRAPVPGALRLALDGMANEQPSPEQLAAVVANVHSAVGMAQPHPSLSRVTAPTGAPAVGATAVKSLTTGKLIATITSSLALGALCATAVLVVTRAPASRATPASANADQRPRASARPSSSTEAATALIDNDPRPATPTSAPRRAEPETSAPANVRPLWPAAPAPNEIAWETQGWASTPAAPPTSELDLLTAAQSAIDRDPLAALQLVGEHERRFGNGALNQEREVIAIAALMRLGRVDEASARADRFSAQFPRSAHARRIDVLLHSP